MRTQEHKTAGSKYGHLITKTVSWGSEQDDTQINEHAWERWDERTPEWSHSPEYAWDNGAWVPEWFHTPFADKWGNEPDEVRVFHEHTDSGNYQVALVARDGVIRTILKMKTFSPPIKAFTNALRYHVPDGDLVGGGR